jgi:hypothetical protein
MTILSASMRPLQWPSSYNVAQLEPLNRDPGVNSNLAIDKIAKASHLPTIAETKTDGTKPCCNRSMAELKVEGVQRDRLNSESDIGRLRLRKASATGSFKGSKGDLDRTVPLLARKDIYYSGSIHNLKEYQSQRSLNAYRQSVTSLNKSNIAVHHTEVDTDQEKPGLFDLSLLKDPAFMLLALSNLFGGKIQLIKRIFVNFVLFQVWRLSLYHSFISSMQLPKM